MPASIFNQPTSKFTREIAGSAGLCDFAVGGLRCKAHANWPIDKEIRKQQKRIGRNASFKVSLAFMGASMADITMLITDLLRSFL